MCELWTWYGAYKEGERHKERNMQCQDRMAYRENGHRQAIAMVDGVGETDWNPVAGERVAGVVAEFLLDHFEDVPRENKYRLGNVLMRGIYDVILETMEQCQLPAREFNSTFMGACIDHDTGRYCLVHLGAGVIISGGADERVLSYPFNGVGEGETCFTLSERALEKMKIFTGMADGMTSIALCSDGVYGMRSRVKEVFGKVEEFRRSNSIYGDGEDDQGIILLERPVEYRV